MPGSRSKLSEVIDIRSASSAPSEGPSRLLARAETREVRLLTLGKGRELLPRHARGERTETQVHLKGVHLCCGGCTDAVAAAVESVPGATCRCDMENGTVTLTARDCAAAQQALDAIADAGLHGETGDAHLAMKTQRDVPRGKVRRLTVCGIHNCCEPCYEAIKGAVDTVEGVSGDTAQPGRTTFEVTGHFSATELVGALNAAGFHAKVKV